MTKGQSFIDQIPEKKLAKMPRRAALTVIYRRTLSGQLVKIEKRRSC